ncbi:MAG: helix-turn-helix domain-containing protein [Ruminococcaceae bacterium]|nr:helix-turn-helix domain-containing protein [Oscillospiraceae bacterium]
MRLCELTNYGVFDTKIARPDKKRSASRNTDVFEIEYYISANGKAIINDRAYEMAPGTLLCAKPGQKRSSIFHFRCYFLHIRLPEDSRYRALLEQTPDFFQIVDGQAYGRLFETLTEHLLSEGYDPDSDFVNAKLLELFYYLNKDSQNNRNCPEQFDRNNYRFIPKVLEYIQQNHQKNLTLAEMADLAGYSPNYFHNIFRTVMGITPQEYLMQQRLQHAKLLLIHTDNTLSEIAYECGFSSQSHLCARFKRSVLCTPGEYRQRNMNRYRT